MPADKNNDDDLLIPPCQTCGRDSDVRIEAHNMVILRCASCYSIEVANTHCTADGMVFDKEKNLFRRPTEDERRKQRLVKESYIQRKMGAGTKKAEEAKNKISDIASSLAKKKSMNYEYDF